MPSNRAQRTNLRAWLAVVLATMAVALAWALPASASAAGRPVTMATCERVDLDGSTLRAWTGAERPVDPGQAASRAFDPVDGHQLNFGLRRAPVWLTFSLGSTKCREPLYLDLGNPYANRVQVFGRAPDGGWRLEWDSDAAASAGEAPRIRRAVVPLEPRGRTDYLVSVGGPASIVVAPSIVAGVDQFAARAAGRSLSGGMLAGGIVAMAIYFIFLGAMLGVRGLTAFAGSALALALFYLSSSGGLDPLLLDLAADLAGARDLTLRVNGFGVLTASLFHWLFVRGLLAPGGDESAGVAGLPEGRVLAGWAALFALIPFLDGRTAAMFCMGVAALAIPFVVREVWRAMRADHPLARVTLVSFGALALATFVYITAYAGLMPLRPWMIDGIALGVWAEAIALSVAIGAHVKDLRGRQLQLQARTEELSLLSQIDPLTGLGNRRAYDTIVAAEIAQCQRRGSEAVVLVVDIDHFKQVNDTWGHGFGDSVIRILSATIANSVRSADRAFRYGGEEFVLLLPDIGLEAGRAIAERIMREFTNCSPTAPDGSRPFFSVSIGVALLGPDDTPETLFTRADAAMYRAKQAGRCRVECEHPPGRLPEVGSPAARDTSDEDDTVGFAA